MTPAEAIKLAELACECDGVLSCLYCMLADVIREQPMMKAAVKAAHDKHNIHIEALKHYYHRLHKTCPCLDSTGKCECPWQTIGVEEEKTLSREDELKAIELFLERKKNANRSNRNVTSGPRAIS